MTREGTILYSNELLQFKKDLEADTGFVCYEVQPGDQTTFYGTSDMFDDFKTAVGTMFNTGTIAFLIDIGEKFMYSKYKDEWFELS